MNYFDKARTGGIYTKHGRKAQKTLMDRRHTQNIHARPTHIQHTDGRHIKHARTEGIQHTINVLIPDSARRPENSENNSCAREARPNFKFFLGRNLSSFVFCLSNFVCQILCFNWRILMEISAFLAKQRFTRIFHENPDLSGFSVKSSI